MVTEINRGELERITRNTQPRILRMWRQERHQADKEINTRDASISGVRETAGEESERERGERHRWLKGQKLVA